MYLCDVLLSSSCIVVFRSIIMLSVLVYVDLPRTNVHLAHLSRPNSIWMSPEYRFTNFSCSNFSLFSAKSFRSSMCSRCVTFPFSLGILVLDVRVYRCPCLLKRGCSVGPGPGERLPHWKISRRIFTSGILIFPSECCNIHVVFQNSIAFSIILIVWGLIFYTCMHFVIHECGTECSASRPPFCVRWWYIISTYILCICVRVSAVCVNGLIVCWSNQCK